MDQSEITIGLLTVREKQATDMCTWLTQENERMRGLLTPADVAPFSSADGSVVGPNLRFDDGALVEPERQSDVSAGKEIILDAIVDMLNGAYRSGHDAAQLAKDTALRDLEAVRVGAATTEAAMTVLHENFEATIIDRDNLRALLREAVDMATMQLNHLDRNVETKANRLAAIAKEGKL